MRVVQKMLVACLVGLPTIAFADVYPLNPPPDVFTGGFTFSGSSVTGTAESITDFGNCSVLPCNAVSPTTTNFLDFYQNSTGFVISDGPNGTGNVYLSGTEIATKVDAGGEVGYIFDITTDNNLLWSQLESQYGGNQTASSFGPVVVMDYHNYGTNDATADMTPVPGPPFVTPVPEPASFTLLLSGLAAGYFRKRASAKKS